MWFARERKLEMAIEGCWQVGDRSFPCTSSEQPFYPTDTRKMFGPLCFERDAWISSNELRRCSRQWDMRARGLGKGDVWESENKYRLEATQFHRRTLFDDHDNARHFGMIDLWIDFIKSKVIWIWNGCCLKAFPWLRQKLRLDGRSFWYFETLWWPM